MKRILPILAAAMAAAGILILSWPVLAEFLTACTQDEIIAGYDSGLAGADRERIEKEMEAALRYNEKLSDGTGAPAFSSEEKDPAYDRLLENSDGVMCVVEIPKLSVRLPVYHGTSDEALKKGAGHLYGSSLPVGGPSSHAVIAAHTALPGEELFTHIDELETGDFFRIRVLGQIHFYRVDRIRVVLPEETDDLRIEEGKDFVTLYTCTPYGINTHRLLVRGVRDQDAENAEQNQPDAVTELNDGKGETVKKFLKLGISAVLMMLMTAMLVFACAGNVSASAARGLSFPGADPQRKGSLTIRYYKDVQEKEPLAGAGFTLLKTEDYGPEGFSADNVSEEFCLTDATDEEGICIFENLPVGVYLVRETEPVKGYRASVPFQISIPISDGQNWQYELTAEPKSFQKDEDSSGAAESVGTDSQEAESAGTDLEEGESAGTDSRETESGWTDSQDASGFTVIEPTVVTGDPDTAAWDIAAMAGAYAVMAAACRCGKKKRAQKKNP